MLINQYCGSKVHGYFVMNWTCTKPFGLKMNFFFILPLKISQELGHNGRTQTKTARKMGFSFQNWFQIEQLLIRSTTAELGLPVVDHKTQYNTFSRNLYDGFQQSTGSTWRGEGLFSTVCLEHCHAGSSQLHCLEAKTEYFRIYRKWAMTPSHTNVLLFIYLAQKIRGSDYWRRAAPFPVN
jgi:hypothetical protein